MASLKDQASHYVFLSIINPEHHRMCLTPISLPVSFENLKICPCEQAGYEGVGSRAGVGWVGQMWRNRAFVLVRAAIKIENALCVWRTRLAV